MILLKSMSTMFLNDARKSVGAVMTALMTLETRHDDVIKWKHFPRWIPRTKASDVELWCFFDLCLTKKLSKQMWGWWFEMPLCPLWCHCNDLFTISSTLHIFLLIKHIYQHVRFLIISQHFLWVLKLEYLGELSHHHSCWWLLVSSLIIKTVMRLSHLDTGNFYSGKMTSLYWDGPQKPWYWLSSCHPWGFERPMPSHVQKHYHHGYLSLKASAWRG